MAARPRPRLCIFGSPPRVLAGCDLAGQGRGGGVGERVGSAPAFGRVLKFAIIVSQGCWSKCMGADQFWLYGCHTDRGAAQKCSNPQDSPPQILAGN